jgi:hypothetical protein
VGADRKLDYNAKKKRKEIIASSMYCLAVHSHITQLARLSRAELVAQYICHGTYVHGSMLITSG